MCVRMAINYLFQSKNRCPVEGCEWVGKEECFCHTGKKVKEWPESYVEKENKK